MGPNIRAKIVICLEENIGVNCHHLALVTKRKCKLNFIKFKTFVIKRHKKYENTNHRKGLNICKYLNIYYV